MSAPVFTGAGAPSANGTTANPTWPTHQVDDIGLLFVQTSNQTCPTPAGWTIAATAQGVGTAGAAGSTMLSVFWKRAASVVESAPAVGDSGDHQIAVILGFRGCETSGSPIHATAGDTLTPAGTAVTFPGLTTLVDECLVVMGNAHGTDTTAFQTVVSGWTNASLTGFARIHSKSYAANNGGGFDIGAGEKATAGVVSSGSTTLSTASLQARITLALKPPAAPPATVTEGGIYVASGEKAAAGSTGNTTATMDTASVQARITIALKPPAAPPANLAPVVGAISDKVAAIDVALAFALDISDPEGDTVTVTLEAGATDVPAGAVIVEEEGGDFSFSWTPTSGQTGEWNVTVRADDGTNTTDRSFTIVVAEEPDTTLLLLAQAIAARAKADVESAQALADLLEDREQMNSKVLHDVRTLISDLQTTQTYFDEVIAQLEEETEA